MLTSLKRHLGLLARIALGLIVVAGSALFLRRLDLSSVGRALASASLPLVAAAAVVNLAGVWAHGVRYGVLASASRRLSGARLFRYHLAAYAANNVLPGRVGEVVRVQLLRAHEGIPLAAGISAALVEKLFDVVGMLLVVWPVPFLVVGLPRPIATGILTLGVAGAAGLAALFVAGAVSPTTEGRWARWSAAAKVMHEPGRLLRAIAWSVAIWVLDAASVLLVLRAVGIATPSAGALLILLMVNLAIAVPSTPAGIGAFEAGAVTALALLGAAREPSLAFAVIYHAMQVVPVTLLGLPGLRLGALAKERGAAAGELSSENPRNLAADPALQSDDAAGG